MIASESELRRIFEETVTPKIQESIVRCLFGSYQTAYAECVAKFPDKHHSELILRYHRWIQLQSDLLGMNNPSAGINAVSKPYHTLLNIGRIMLTASSCHDETRMIRRALHREQYAYAGQGELFEKNELPPDDARYYAILLHRADRLEPRQPAFARLVFPDKTLTSYLGSIDLFAQHQALIDRLLIPREETVAAEMPITLRKDVKEKTG